MEKVSVFFQAHRQLVFKPGDILIRAGDEPSGVFYLQEGIVRQYSISRNGNEVTLNMFKPQAFFPMSWVMSGVYNSYNFEAMTDCVVYKASSEEVLRFMKKEPDVLFDLLKRVYIGIEGLWLQMEQLSSGNAHTKLVAALLILGKRFGRLGPTGTVIQLKMTEKELGQYAGMYRETVSREFSKLREMKIVTYEASIITIPDIEKLAEEVL